MSSKLLLNLGLFYGPVALADEYPEPEASETFPEPTFWERIQTWFASALFY